MLCTSAKRESSGFCSNVSKNVRTVLCLQIMCRKNEIQISAIPGTFINTLRVLSVPWLSFVSAPSKSLASCVGDTPSYPSAKQVMLSLTALYIQVRNVFRIFCVVVIVHIRSFFFFFQIPNS